MLWKNVQIWRNVQITCKFIAYLSAMVISYTLDTRRANRKGLYPVKIRVSYSKKADHFPTGHYLSQATFDALGTMTSTQATHDEVIAYESRIKAIVARLPVYSVESVRSALTTPAVVDDTPSANDVLVWFKYKEQLCRSTTNSIGTAECYNTAATFYRKYFNSDTIPFEDITVAKLHEIQREKGVDMSLSTIGKYARHLRSIYNLAIAKDFIKRSLYPFGMHKYVPPTSRKRKHALSREAMIALTEYVPATQREQYHLDMFFFSFFGNGLNMKDVATLRYKDMHGSTIIKRREKTMTSGQEPIRITINTELSAIIGRQGNRDTSPNNFIFPLLDSSWSSERMFQELKVLRGKMQRTLTAIAKKLGIEGKIPHGTSRHCFANAMKQSGAPAELISETIGHSSVAVTKHYTSAFDEAGINYQEHLHNYIRRK